MDGTQGIFFKLLEAMSLLHLYPEVIKQLLSTSGPPVELMGPGLSTEEIALFPIIMTLCTKVKTVVGC